MIEHADPLVFNVTDIDIAIGRDRHRIRRIEFAGGTTRLRKQVLEFQPGVEHSYLAGTLVDDDKPTVG